MTEAGFFIGDLKTLLSTYKPIERNLFIASYFEQAQLAESVLGMPYTHVMSSNYNKQCFVYCLMHAFDGFSCRCKLTSVDFYHLIEAICPNYPKNDIIDIVNILDYTVYFANTTVLSSAGMTSNLDTTSIYDASYLLMALCVSIVFSDWIRLIIECYQQDIAKLKMSHIQIIKFKSRIEEFSVVLSPTIRQPPMRAVAAIFDELLIACSSSRSSYRGASTDDDAYDFHLHHFLKKFLTSPLLQREIMLTRMFFHEA